MSDQPEALRVADELETYDDYYTLDAIRLLREQHAEIERLRVENKRLRFECGALIKEQITRDACDVARGIAAREPIKQHVALDAAIAEERKL